MTDLSSCIVAWYGYVRHFLHSDMFQTEFFVYFRLYLNFIFFVTKKKVLQSVTGALSCNVCFVEGDQI
jgi:hypothetical protein